MSISKPSSKTRPKLKPEVDPCPSPCIGVCHIDGSTGFCLGCFRTLPEIAQWHKKTEKERWVVVGEAEKREKNDNENEKNQESV
jgi:hypothetical protein